jgi:hypothetical protein
MIRRGESNRITGTISAIAIIGSVLAVPPTAQGKNFHCRAEDVACLIAAIDGANRNGGDNTIRLAVVTYVLTVANDGLNDLPSITGSITITGVGADKTNIARASGAEIHARRLRKRGLRLLKLRDFSARGLVRQVPFNVTTERT